MGVLRVEIRDETEAVFRMEPLRRKGAEKKHVNPQTYSPKSGSTLT